MRTFGATTILLVLLAAGCAVAGPVSGDPSPKCATNADCVPAECCHPTTCTHKSNAPDCSGVACTMDCRPGTLDCQNGHCECIEGACTARLNNG